MVTVVPDLPELFEEAFERAGLQMQSGYDLRTIRRSLNILTLEWQNRGLNLFTIDSGTVDLVQGQSTYSMPVDTIDLIEHQLRTGTGTSQIDTALQRVSVSTYAQQTNKNIVARPTQIYIERLSTEVKFTLWPLPDGTLPYKLLYFRLKGIDGLATGVGGDTTSIPPRFIPALVSGLAFHVAMKKPEAVARAIPLREEYEHQFKLAADEDQERASSMFVPFQTFHGGMR
mgnify:FL=1|jgi:hypothetical protein|tara:strand:- start:2632 stop:3318 length:687 start_codon:yes stop_codon:yes gene_type:complete